MGKRKERNRFPPTTTASRMHGRADISLRRHRPALMLPLSPGVSFERRCKAAQHMKRFLGMLFTAAMLAVSAAHGCGLCAEDRMAATYVHDLVIGAMDRGHQIVFTDVTSRPMTRTEWHLVSWAVQSIRGVMKGSVRISKSPMALSFEIDPKATNAATAIREINRRFGKQSIRISLIQTMTPPAVASR